MEPEQAAPQVAKPKRDKLGRLLPGGTSNPSGARASIERAAREVIARETEAAALLADLQRPPSATERVAIDRLSAVIVEARKRQRQGKSTLELDRLVTRLLRALGLGRTKPAPPAGPSLAEYAASILAAEAAKDGQGLEKSADPVEPPSPANDAPAAPPGAAPEAP